VRDHGDTEPVGFDSDARRWLALASALLMALGLARASSLATALTKTASQRIVIVASHRDFGAATD
jgi:hypothetical protein